MEYKTQKKSFLLVPLDAYMGHDWTSQIEVVIIFWFSLKVRVILGQEVSSRSHHKQFLFVILTWMPLQLPSLLKRYFFTCFFSLFHPGAERGFRVSLTKKITYGDFLKRLIILIIVKHFNPETSKHGSYTNLESLKEKISLIKG